MCTYKKSQDNLELRSEKVKKILGEVSPSLVRWGIIIVALIFLSLLIAVCLLPYPYSDGKSIIHHLLICR